MSKILRILFSLCSLLTLVSIVAAQELKPKRESPTVTASVTANGLRFVAPRTSVVQIRLQVFSALGEKLSDSKFRRGNIVDWPAGTDKEKPLDLHGDPVLFVVTVRTLSGQLRQRLGLASVDGG